MSTPADLTGWRLTTDEEGRLIVEPVTELQGPIEGYVESLFDQTFVDKGNDPEFERACRARLAW